MSANLEKLALYDGLISSSDLNKAACSTFVPGDLIVAPIDEHGNPIKRVKLTNYEVRHCIETFDYEVTMLGDFTLSLGVMDYVDHVSIYLYDEVNARICDVPIAEATDWQGVDKENDGQLVVKFPSVFRLNVVKYPF